MDDLGSHDLGLHESGINTPHCDQLAKEGVYLSNYYVLPTCSPTRAALLSGKYPLHTGVHTVIKPNSTRGLPLDEETLPQVLKKAGYSTHAVGKWHVGHSNWQQTPTYRGFDSFFGYYLGGQDYFTHRQVGAYDQRWDARSNCGADCSLLVDETGNYSTHVYTREAINRIREHENANEPLFLYLAFQAVHSPLEVPYEYKEPYMANDNVDQTDEATRWSSKRITYAGMLSAADEGIGKVTAALKKYGLWDDTLIVFTTDNGGPTEVCAVQGSSNYPLRGGKCTVWEGGTTGDGFVSGPALETLSIPTATKAKGLFHVVDWLPTLGEIAGASKDAKIDGVSQLEALKTGKPARKEIFVGYGFDQTNWYGPAIRVNNWKLIEGNGGPDSRTDELSMGNGKKALTNRIKQQSLGGFRGFDGHYRGNDSRQKAIMRFREGHRDLEDQDGDAKEQEEKDIYRDEARIPEGCTNNRELADDEPFYLLFNLKNDKEERHNVAVQFPEVVRELSEKLEAYKEEFVPEADERECPNERIAETPNFGATRLPWCTDSRILVVYE